MPVTGTATTSTVVTLDDIRGFLRDVAGQVPGTGVENILFDLPEFSDDDIRRALKFSVSRFNVMTPVSNDSEGTVPAWLLLLAVSEFLLRSEATRQLRNQLTYQAGNVAPIGIDDKAQLYLQMADTIKAEYEDKAKAWKVSRNMESCYGSLGSGYRSVSRFHHSS